MEENKNEEAKKVEKNETQEAVKSEKAEPKKEEKKEETKKVAPNETAEKKNENPIKDESNSSKKKGKAKFIIMAVIVLVVIVALIVYFAVFKKKTIDLAKYIEVEYDGYNGYATATVTIDDTLKDYLDSKSLYEKFLEKAELEIENNEDLSNGDELEIEVSISSNWLNEKKLKLKDTTIKIVVEGLEDADVLDVFGDEDFEIEITGISPDLSISVNNNSSNTFIKNNVSYSLSEYGGLANGDVVTITAYYDEYAADEEGIVVAKDTMEYTIEGQAEYIDEVSDLTDEILETIRAEFVEEVKEQIEYYEGSIIRGNYDEVTYSEEFTNTEPELVATYLLTKKGTSYWYSENIVYGIYKVVYTSTTTGANYEWYYVASVSDVAIKDEALYEPDDLYYDVSGSWDDGETQEDAYDDLIDSNKSNYVIETVE